LIKITEWRNITELDSKKYICPYCRNLVASVSGFCRGYGSVEIFICPCCDKPTIFFIDTQIPFEKYGDSVSGIEDALVNSLYDEARVNIAVQSYTTSMMASRKLIMNISVAKGASTGKSFAYYVDYLDEKGYIPPDAKKYIDYVRKQGNLANHEIEDTTETDAKTRIDFIGMLLKFIYEFPNKFKHIV
jgi:hypothetical protein